MHSSRMRTVRPFTVFPGGSVLVGWGGAVRSALSGLGSALAGGVCLPWGGGESKPKYVLGGGSA